VLPEISPCPGVLGVHRGNKRTTAAGCLEIQYRRNARVYGWYVFTNELLCYDRGFRSDDTVAPRILVAS
jgi:hypothetical protein